MNIFERSVAERLGGGVENPHVGLVQDDQVQVGDREAGVGSDAADRFIEQANGPFEHAATVHPQVVQVGGEALGACRCA